MGTYDVVHRKWNNAVQPTATNSADFPFPVRHPMSPQSSVKIFQSGSGNSCTECCAIIKGGIFEAGFVEKVAFSWPSVDRFGKFLVGLMTLGQVKSVPNFC